MSAFCPPDLFSIDELREEIANIYQNIEFKDEQNEDDTDENIFYWKNTNNIRGFNNVDLYQRHNYGINQFLDFYIIQYIDEIINENSFNSIENANKAIITLDNSNNHFTLDNIQSEYGNWKLLEIKLYLHDSDYMITYNWCKKNNTNEHEKYWCIFNMNEYLSDNNVKAFDNFESVKNFLKKHVYNFIDSSYFIDFSYFNKNINKEKLKKEIKRREEAERKRQEEEAEIMRQLADANEEQEANRKLFEKISTKIINNKFKSFEIVNYEDTLRTSIRNIYEKLLTLNNKMTAQFYPIIGGNIYNHISSAKLKNKNDIYINDETRKSINQIIDELHDAVEHKNDDIQTELFNLLKEIFEMMFDDIIYSEDN